MKDWEIIADNLSKAGWSWGCVSAVDSEGRTIWIVDAHCGDGDRFIVRADEKLTAFLELERGFGQAGNGLDDAFLRSLGRARRGDVGRRFYCACLKRH
jgi:hypothetical protein